MLELKGRFHFPKTFFHPILVHVCTYKFFRTKPQLLRLGSFCDIRDQPVSYFYK